MDTTPRGDSVRAARYWAACAVRVASVLLMFRAAPIVWRTVEEVFRVAVFDRPGAEIGRVVGLAALGVVLSAGPWLVAGAVIYGRAAWFARRCFPRPAGGCPECGYPTTPNAGRRGPECGWPGDSSA